MAPKFPNNHENNMRIKQLNMLTGQFFCEQMFDTYVDTLFLNPQKLTIV